MPWKSVRRVYNWTASGFASLCILYSISSLRYCEKSHPALALSLRSIKERPKRYRFSSVKCRLSNGSSGGPIIDICIFSSLPGNTISTQCAHVWAGGEMISFIFDLDVRLVPVLPMLVSILVRLMVQLQSQQTWKTTMSNIVELVGQIKDRHSVKEILLEQLRCGMRCDKLKC